MSNELVSIIVRTKDRPLLLEQALRSIAAQTYRPIEAVVVNDGGCRLDPVRLGGLLGDVGLAYVPLAENHGRAHAANVGVENARGAYVGFLDDDDEYYFAGIDALVGAVRDNSLTVVYGKVVCRTYDSSGAPVEGGDFVIGAPFNARRLFFENTIATNSLLVPAAFFMETGPFDTTFEIYEDWDYLIRLAAQHDFRFVDALIGEYRIFGTATITGKGGSSLQSLYREKILAKHLNKARASDFIEYVQSVVDRIVLDKERYADKLKGLIKERDAEIGRLREGEAWLKDTVASREAEIARLREGEAWLKDTVAARELEIARLNGVLESVLASHSWRITKPLRALGSTAKRILNRTDEEIRTTG